MTAGAVAGTCSALATVISLYRIYWISIMQQRLSVHLRRGAPYDSNITIWDVCFGSGSAWFWFEVAICILHIPPISGTWEFSSTFMSNVVVYRLETIGCAATMMRVYLVWRVIAYYVLKDLPSKHNIAGYAGIQFDSTFVVKWMLNSWHAVFYISMGWFGVLIVASYIYRLAEHMHSCLIRFSHHEACVRDEAKVWSLYGRDFEKENDLNIFNSFWFIFTCIMPGSGGNVAVATHFGRCVAAGAVIAGVLIGSLTTAALGNLMIFTPAEHTARGIMKRESCRILYMRAAANIIALWWRKRRAPKNINRVQRKMDIFGYRREFVAAERVLRVDLEECASTQAKINQIVSHTKELSATLDEVGVNLFSLGMDRKQRLAISRTNSPSLPSSPST